MKIFITGASGFIGGATAKHLANTHTVFAMARSDTAAKKVESLGAQAVHCDLKGVEPKDLAGCEAVIHCAAYAEEWGSESDFYDSNVTATGRLLEVAKKAGISRFIFIGTEAALFHGQDMIDVDESYPYAIRSPYPYSRTKGEAERLVLAASTSGFTALSLRPRMVWGPEDQSILPAILHMIESRRFAWIGAGNYQTSTTHVANLVHAIELALTRGSGGNPYFIANDETMQMRNFLTRYIETQGVAPPNNTVPRVLARLLARATDIAWKALHIRRKPPLVRFSVDIMSAHCTIRTDKAKLELGYQPVITTEAGLATMPRLTS